MKKSKERLIRTANNTNINITQNQLGKQQNLDDKNREKIIA